MKHDDIALNPLLSARGICAGYDNRAVLHNVDLEVQAGQFWAVLGPNGAGKSTLIRVCLGLRPVQAGTVAVDGAPITSLGRRALAQTVAWMPQGAEVISGFTGLELVLMGLYPRLGMWGIPSAHDIEHANSVLDELRITHLACRPVVEISGGERQLLLLARALVQNPRLLFLDEPTAFLDLKHQVEVLRLVKTLVAKGLGVVAVLHDVNLAAAFADKVLLLREGKVLDSGSVDTIFRGDALERLFDLRMARAEASTGQRLFAPRMP